MVLLWPGSSGASPMPAGSPRSAAPRALPLTGLLTPYDVELDVIGNVYVADSGNNRVVKLPAGGGPQVTLGFTGLSLPTNMAITKNGDIYLSDTGNNRVLRLPAGGGPQEVLATGLQAPRGIAIDGAGNRYYANSGGTSIYKQGSAGGVLTTVVGGLKDPTDVDVDAAGNIYAVDKGNNRVVKVAAVGGGQTTLPFTGINAPQELVIDRAGTFFVSDLDGVVKLPAGGTQSALAIVPLLGSRGMALDAVGTVYVTDTGSNRVLKLPAGVGTQSFRATSFGARGLAVDGAGNLYAANTAGNSVVKLPVGGGAAVTLGFSGLSGPLGVAVDGGGNVYVADTNNGRVLKLPPGGSQSVVPFGGLSSPVGVAVDPQGNIYVSDADSNFVAKLPIGGGSLVTVPFTGLSGPTALAVGPGGDVYVVDSGNVRVLRLPGGTGAQEILGFTGVGIANYLAVDSDRDVFLTDYVNGKVLELAGGGDGQVTLGFPALSVPMGIALTADGTVHVADAGNSRIASLATGLPQLRATTNPAVAGDIIVDGVTRDSWGLNWAQLPPGPHEVCFGDVAGLVKPACTTPTLSVGATTVVQGNYTANGYLRAITSPAVASTITVDGVPRNDYGMWAEVAPATYNVCFGNVAGYTAPACRNVTVVAGATATTTGTFTTNAAGPPPPGPFGYLRAVTNPALGALISVDGQWRDNWGLNWVKVPVGPHQVCFGPVAGRIAPACQTATITNGSTSVITGTYTPKGFLRVLTSPAVPGAIYVDGDVANNWGMWPAKPAGTYSVCFGPVVGYTSPPCQYGVTVTPGATTTITGTYTP